jgi:pimeloyl-ACP methyl ester carboxylesterase
VVGPLNGYDYSIGRSAAQQKVQAALDADPEKAEIFRRPWGRKKEDVASTVAFHTYLIHEAQERSGGNPFSNLTTIYNVDDDHVKVNNGVKRFAADPGANAYLKKWYTATGKTTKPLFIMSPVYDPIVPADTTEAYMALAARQDNLDKVVFQIYNHYGHGSVTTAEVANAFDALLKWMKGGPKPPSGLGVSIDEPRRAPAARAGQ